MMSACTNPRRTLVAIAVAGLLQTATPNPASAEIDWATAARAEDLQACLNRELGAVVTSETRFDDGIAQDRSAIDESFDRRQLGDAISRCQRHTQCTATRGLSRAVNVQAHFGESHPAWSSNDRARLADLIPQQIAKQLRDHPKAHSVSTAHTPEDADTLDVSIDFGGLGWTTRDLQDWVSGPRSVTVSMSLLAQAASTAVATQSVTIKLPPLPRSHWADNSSAKWLQNTLSAVDTGTRNLLDARGCSTEIVDVRRSRTGRLQLDLSTVRGLRAGRTIMLVPLESTQGSSRWPLASVTAVTERVAELELADSSAEICSRAECSAIVL